MAPVVYDYAYTMVEGKTPAQMPGVLRTTFTGTVEVVEKAPSGVGVEVVVAPEDGDVGAQAGDGDAPAIWSDQG